MIQSFFTGANGLRSQQNSIDVLANNVANIGTTGYKQARMDFKDALYNRMKNQVDNGEHMNLQHGTGVIPMQANHIFLQGVSTSTDRPLDFMIEGDGFFVIEGNEGEEPVYTRNGNFEISVEEDGESGFLITQQGRYVLDENGERIMLSGDLERMSVSRDGSIYFVNEEGDYDETGIKLGVVTFVNPVGLEVTGGNYFAETENSGAAEPMESPSVYNRALEGSNVDYALETTRLIRAQRAYQLASRCVTTADQMAGLANTIRQ